MNRARIVLTGLIAALILSIVPLNAYAAPLKVSTASAVIDPDLRGNVVVRVKYRDYGFLGVKPVAVCAYAQPRYVAKVLRVKFRYAGFTTLNMGEYKMRQPNVCKRISTKYVKRTKIREWNAYGLAVTWRLVGVDVFTDSFDVATRMK